MKKICIFALVLLLGVSFAGCRRDKTDETQPSTESTTTPITMPTILPSIEPTIETNIPDPGINTETPDMMS